MLLLFHILFPPRKSATEARAISHRDIAPLINPVRIASVSPLAISLLPYRNTSVQTLITEAKFHNSIHAQHILGAVLADYLATLDTNAILVPIPLSKKRERERGYNQVERICRAALEQIDGFSVETKLLVRTRNTTPQTNLGGRARRKNLKGAFAVSQPPQPNTLYIVVDDVITTGATLSEAVQALKNAGALRILPLTLAHSP